MDRADPVAFITGAGSGIGRAVAQRLASRGDAVAVFDLSAVGAAATVAQIESAGGRAIALTGDVTSSQDLDHAVETTIEQFGGLTTVVANAGIEMMGTVLTTSEKDWQRAVSVMLTGTFLTARSTVPSLLERRGAFVAVASDAGVAGFQNWAAYVAAKHGVVGLVRAMALDHGPDGLRSNVVCPGPTQTPLMDRVMVGVPEERFLEYTRDVPLGRLAEPEMIADVIAHLSSDDARHTNGLVYMVDGGTNAGPYDPAEITTVPSNGG